MSQFKDHFSSHSSDYASYRPGYPEELFSYLASLTPEHKTAWDCATGTGQSARGLKKYFSTVIATDASENQIKNVQQQDGIQYYVAPAESVPVADNSLDLITVAQALHWFDIPAFFNEANRVLKDKGILAVWSYKLLKISPAIDAIITHFYSDTLGAYWPEERELIENDYADIVFPFAAVPTEIFSMQSDWNLSQLTGYLGTWSAVKKYNKARQADAITALQAQLEDAWGDINTARQVEWPLKLHVRQK